MNAHDRVFVAGHRGMVGSAIVRRLQRDGFDHVITRTRDELDLRDAAAVRAWFERERPDVVFLAAAHVGGIVANDSAPVQFLRDNLAIQLAVIDAAHHARVRKLVFLGSSCVYPRLAPQPITEEALLTGPLEPTNEWYAIAKIAGIKLCQAYRRQYGDDFIAVMPTNLYGPGDNFDLEKSHVLPALIRKYVEAVRDGAPAVTLWGSGNPRREFLHVDDLADACLFLARNFSGDVPLNIGWGKDIPIAELARMVADIVGFRGTTTWDASRPDGTPRKLLDTSRLSALGWSPRIPLRDGIESTVRWYLSAATPPLPA